LIPLRLGSLLSELNFLKKSIIKDESTQRESNFKNQSVAMKYEHVNVGNKENQTHEKYTSK